MHRLYYFWFAACIIIDLQLSEIHSLCLTSSICNCTSYEAFCRSKGTDLSVSIENAIISIKCLTISATLLNDQWTEMLSELKINGEYHTLQIQLCAVPRKSIRWILDTLSINSTSKLYLNLMKTQLNNFHESYFRDLDSIKALEISQTNVTSLPDSVFNGLPNLESLILRSTNLQSISANLFKPVNKVRFLDIGSNNLNGLEHDVFKYLSNLSILNINGNKVTNLTKDLFLYTQNLSKLDLSGNELEVLPEDIFQHLIKLTVLNLNFNNISKLPEAIFNNTKSLKDFRGIQSHNKKLSALPRKLFSNLELLENVIMERNNLSTIPEDLFNAALNLNSVSLNRNILKQLPGQLFKYSIKLKAIDVSFNRLVFLNETTFKGLVNLKTLNLQHNELSYINGSVFKDLRLLEILNLDNNKLMYLHKEVFSSLFQLRVIRLNNNLLDMKTGENARSPLEACVNIVEIHLRNNTVEIIMGDWLFIHSQLRILDLSYNKLKRLEKEALQFLSPNVKFDLRHNQIGTINMTGLEKFVKFLCESPPCTSSSKTREVLLDGNRITCDCNLYDFVRFLRRDMTPSAMMYASIADSELLRCSSPNQWRNSFLMNIVPQTLYCPWNGTDDNPCPRRCSCSIPGYTEGVMILNCDNVTNLPTSLPHTQYENVELLLSHNNIRNLHNITYMNSSKIVKLSLAFNLLANIHSLTIPPSLKALELDHNEITYLDAKDFEMLSRTNSDTLITLHNNPWKCDCSTKNLSNFVHNRRTQMLYVDNVTCADSGIPVYQYQVSELCNLPTRLIFTCISVAILGLLFGAATLFYLNYQHEIRVWMYAHKICMWLISEKDVDRDKEYDAFVTYSHLDEEFVVKHLKPGLEDGPIQYKLCLHYRDWVVGGYIPEQIIRSVGSSRRTIVVLSSNFLKSIWGKLEFRTAHLEAIKERHARVIIILLSDLEPNDQIDPELKAYLTMNTYLKWDDPWFWERLRYAMPHRNRHKKI